MPVSVGKNCSRVGRQLYFAMDALERARDNVGDAECFTQNVSYIRKQVALAREHCEMAESLLKDFVVALNAQPPVLLDRAV